MNLGLIYGNRTRRVYSSTVIEGRELFEEQQLLFFLPSDTEDIGDKDSDIDEIPDDGLRKNMNQLEFEEELESNFSISSTSKKQHIN